MAPQAQPAGGTAWTWRGNAGARHARGRGPLGARGALYLGRRGASGCAGPVGARTSRGRGRHGAWARDALERGNAVARRDVTQMFQLAMFDCHFLQKLELKCTKSQ
jgi:hypothetical protein